MRATPAQLPPGKPQVEPPGTLQKHRGTSLTGDCNDLKFDHTGNFVTPARNSWWDHACPSTLAAKLSAEIKRMELDASWVLTWHGTAL